jgi:hypothetical protein
LVGAVGNKILGAISQKKMEDHTTPSLLESLEEALSIWTKQPEHDTTHSIMATRKRPASSGGDSGEHKSAVIRPRFDPADIFLQQHHQWGDQQHIQQKPSPTDAVGSGEKSVSSDELLEPHRVSAFHPSGVVAKDHPRAVQKYQQMFEQQQQQPSFVQYIPYLFPAAAIDPRLNFPNASTAVNAMLALQQGVPSSPPQTQTSISSAGEHQRQEGDDVDQLFTFPDDENEARQAEAKQSAHSIALLQPTPGQSKHQQMMMVHMKHNPHGNQSKAESGSEVGTVDAGDAGQDKVSKANIAFKRSCKICTERRVKCSGPPGPCVTCLKKGLGRDLCVFLPRRKPGPKKREFDLLLGLNSTLALTDEQFISESVHMVFR